MTADEISARPHKARQRIRILPESEQHGIAYRKLPRLPHDNGDAKFTGLRRYFRDCADDHGRLTDPMPAPFDHVAIDCIADRVQQVRMLLQVAVASVDIYGVGHGALLAVLVA